MLGSVMLLNSFSINHKTIIMLGEPYEDEDFSNENSEFLEEIESDVPRVSVEVVEKTTYNWECTKCGNYNEQDDEPSTGEMLNCNSCTAMFECGDVE